MIFEIMFTNNKLFVNGKYLVPFEGIYELNSLFDWIKILISHESNPILKLLDYQSNSKILLIELFRRILVKETKIPKLRLSSDDTVWVVGSNHKHILRSDYSLDEVSLLLDLLFSEEKNDQYFQDPIEKILKYIKINRVMKINSYGDEYEIITMMDISTLKHNPIKIIELCDNCENIIFWGSVGRPAIKFSIKNGELDGKYQLFDSNGVKKLETYFNNGLEIGPHKRWDNNGIKFLEHNGIKIIRYYENGNINSNIILTNFNIFLNPDLPDYQVLKGINIFSELKLDGTFESYFDNGYPCIKSTYVNGILNGPYEEYYLNGKLKEVKNYRCGVLHGPYLSYDVHGTSKQHKYFNNGWDNSIIRYYDSCGNPIYH